MKLRRVIQEKVHARLRGTQLSSDLNAAIAVNVGERGQTVGASSTQPDGAETEAAASAFHPEQGKEEAR